MRLVLLACLVVALGFQSPKREEQTKQPAQQKDKGASSPQREAGPSAPQSSPVGQPASSSENKRETEKNGYLKHVSDPEVLPNWLLFFVGATGVVFAYRTLRSLETQTSAMNITADAAKKSADVAEQALRIAERADVLLNAAVYHHGRVMSGQDATIEIQFKNFGRTRAINVQLRLDVVIEGVPSPDSKLTPQVTMGAGDTQSINSDYFARLLTPQTASGVFQGKIPFRFEAQATYEDVFGQKHTTHCTGLLSPGKDAFLIERTVSD